MYNVYKVHKTKCLLVVYYGYKVHITKYVCCVNIYNFHKMKCVLCITGKKFIRQNVCLLCILRVSFIQENVCLLCVYWYKVYTTMCVCWVYQVWGSNNEIPVCFVLRVYKVHVTDACLLCIMGARFI